MFKNSQAFIDKVDKEFKYYSIEECIAANGHRHLERAIAYASANYPDRYVEGSLRKARREFKKAEAFKLDPITQALVDMFTSTIARNVLKSNAN